MMGGGTGTGYGVKVMSKQINIKKMAEQRDIDSLEIGDIVLCYDRGAMLVNDVDRERHLYEFAFWKMPGTFRTVAYDTFRRAQLAPYQQTETLRPDNPLRHIQFNDVRGDDEMLLEHMQKMEAVGLTKEIAYDILLKVMSGDARRVLQNE